MDGVTRTASDVQAEIDALEERARSACKAAVSTGVGLDDALRLVAETDDRVEPLKSERDRLARQELDAATHPAARNRAMRLRAAHRAREDLQVLKPGETWSSLPLDEARAWAAVEREAARL